MASDPVVIRLPRTSYLVVVFLFFGTIPLAFADNHPRNLDDSTRSSSGFGFAGFDVGLRALLLLIPIAAAIFIARTATVVSRDGLKVRALFGSRTLSWDAIRGLSVSGRGIYAVIKGGAVRLPCVRIAHLGPMSRASEGRLPELDDSTPKPAPQRKRSR